MEQTAFSLTYDYRCPFARNANEHVIEAIRAGAPLSVRFTPFVLGSAYGTEGDPAIWDDLSARPTLAALAASIVVRDRFPSEFLNTHLALFNFRHEQAGDLRDEHALRTVLDDVGVNSASVFAELSQAWPYTLLREEHQQSLNEHSVFGVPTFIANGNAAFVRIMSRPNGDSKSAVSTVESVLSLLFDHSEINEFKHTSIPQ